MTRRWDTLRARITARLSGSAVLGARWRLLGPLTAAARLGDRAALIGFDWPDARDALEKVAEEVEEIAEVLATSPPDRDALEDELGDLLFSAVMVARKANLSPARALRRANAKFHRRFALIERELRRRDIPLDAADLDTMEAIWQEAKRR